MEAVEKSLLASLGSLFPFNYEGIIQGTVKDSPSLLNELKIRVTTAGSGVQLSETGKDQLRTYYSENVGDTGSVRAAIVLAERILSTIQEWARQDKFNAGLVEFSKKELEDADGVKSFYPMSNQVLTFLGFRQKADDNEDIFIFRLSSTRMARSVDELLADLQRRGIVARVSSTAVLSEAEQKLRYDLGLSLNAANEEVTDASFGKNYATMVAEVAESLDQSPVARQEWVQVKQAWVQQQAPASSGVFVTDTAIDSEISNAVGALGDPKIIVDGDARKELESRIVALVQSALRGRNHDEAKKKKSSLSEAVLDHNLGAVILEHLAARGASASSAAVGGINFDPALMDLQVKRDNNGVPLPLPQQDIMNINIEGLFPVIINIQPAAMTNFPLLSSLEEAELKKLSKN